jgi:hypothetical protein
MRGADAVALFKAEQGNKFGRSIELKKPFGGSVRLGKQTATASFTSFERTYPLAITSIKAARATDTFSSVREAT